MLLVYRTWRYDLQVRVAVQMMKWDGVDINSHVLRLFDVLGEESSTHADFMAVGQQFFAALYGQSTGTSMTQARLNLYTHKQEKPPRIMLLSPTDTNLYLHVRRAHLHMLVWMSADQQGSPGVSISEYGW